jgi:uncharacterized protein (DUF302 family)
MQTHRYGLKVTTTAGVEEAEAAIREALAAEGFGVLTEIDLSATLHTKLGLDLPPYRILGACRPPLAAQAVAAEPDIGLLLPCNVVVYAEDDHTVVAALDPIMMMDVTGNQTLHVVALDARSRIERALQAVGS